MRFFSKRKKVVAGSTRVNGSVFFVPKTDFLFASCSQLTNVYQAVVTVNLPYSQNTIYDKSLPTYNGEIDPGCSGLRDLEIHPAPIEAVVALTHVEDFQSETGIKSK